MPAIEIPTFIPATDDLFVYGQQAGVAQPGATTQAMIQEFLRNNSDVLKCFVQLLWQPQKQYALNQIVWSPGMPQNMQAIVTTAGTTGANEPTWNTVVGGSTTDGSVTYKMVEIAPSALPADGGTADTAENANKLGGQAPSYYAKASDLSAKANLASPTFTGAPKAPTAAKGTNTTQIATTAFVMAAVNAISSQGKIVSYSLAQNGYVKWDIGFILQWGTNSSSSSLASISVTFPIAVSATYGVVGSVSRAGSLGSGDVAVVGCGRFRTNGFTAYFDALQNGDASVSTSVTWIAMCKA